MSLAFEGPLSQVTSLEFYFDLGLSPETLLDITNLLQQANNVTSACLNGFVGLSPKILSKIVSKTEVLK
jgi:hypothetical protein